MCGISGIFGQNRKDSHLEAMVTSQSHRGPDASGIYNDPDGYAALGHNRLSIIDLSPAGNQPMASHDGRRWIAFNGEIYNAPELRLELGDYPFRSRTDTEVILAAYQRWGTACLDHLIGMFAFLIWDEREKCLFAARDRFGVKPLCYHQAPDGTLFVASEIKALHAAGVPAEPDVIAWATYLTHGLSDHSERTFWTGIASLPAGHSLIWHDGKTTVTRWYDLAERVGQERDDREVDVVLEEYLSLLQDSVRLRFRADVPVGINLSGGLDSSTLLALVQLVQGAGSEVKAFTYVTDDARYDELPWVRQMLALTRHPLSICRVTPADVPALAESLQFYADEPYGGLPTLTYAHLFQQARAEGVIVLLDGQGMDEQWAGYDYYTSALNGARAGLVQGTSERTVRPCCLTPEFARLAQEFEPPTPFAHALDNLQYRDARHTKLPRALRFHDRASMRSSTELREPFLDHRLFELAMRQGENRKIRNGTHKWLLRQLVRRLIPEALAGAPKRPVQTPQREWLRGPLHPWADARVEEALASFGGDWLDADAVRKEWRMYAQGQGDNSFFVWQWVTLGLLSGAAAA